MTMKVSAAGMAWYRREDYPRILQIMLDADKLPRTFDDWERKATRGEKEMIAKGHLIVRAIIIPDEFNAWCREKGMLPNATARTHFSAEVANQKLRQINPISGKA